MNKIVLDNSCKSDFIDYTMKRVLESQSYNSSIVKYFTKANASKLYDYFANGKTYCNDVGESWRRGEQVSWMSTRISFANGTVITNRDEIIKHEKKCFKNDFYSYREHHLFHLVWCEIERILRVNYLGIRSDWDNKIFKKAVINV